MNNSSEISTSQLSRSLEAILRIVLILLAITLSLLMFGEVILRYVLEIPFLGIEELTILVALWFYFICGAYVSLKDKHLHGGILEVLEVSCHTRLKIKLFSKLLSLVVIMVFCILAVQYTWFLAKYGRQSSYLTISTVYWSLSMVVGFGLTLPILFAQSLHLLKQLRVR